MKAPKVPMEFVGLNTYGLVAELSAYRSCLPLFAGWGSTLSSLEHKFQNCHTYLHLSAWQKKQTNQLESSYILKKFK